MRWKAGESKTAEESPNRVRAMTPGLTLKKGGQTVIYTPPTQLCGGREVDYSNSRQRKEEEGGEKEASFSFPSSFRSASSISVTV